MSILDHLGELRVRLIKCLIAITVCFFIAYTFREPILNFLKSPLLKVLPTDQQYLHYTGLLDELLTALKLSFYAAVAFAMPIILFQLWQFITPGLKPKEKKFLGPFLLFTIGAFIGGMAFAYYIVFPFGFKFLLKYAATDRPILTITNYFSLTTKVLLVFGAIFELPMIFSFLGWLGVLRAETLRKHRKYAILTIAIASAVITPTQDAFTMGAMALLMWILYEGSILLVSLVQRWTGAGDKGVIN